MRIRVGLYARLSDEDRNKAKGSDESESIQNQKRMLLQYALDQGWDVVDIYIDEDYSGAGVYRPSFERMIDDARNGKLDVILCKSQSRFSRDIEVTERYLNNKFKEWNVRFVSLIDNIDTDRRESKKSSQILGLTNEWYLEDLSENVRRTLRNKKENGQFTGSFAPYGYVRSSEDKHKLVIDPIASETVKQIFDMYQKGYGYTSIAKYLNNKGVLSPYEYKKASGSKFVCGLVTSSKSYWNRDTIAKILKDEVYIGNLVQGKTRNLSYKNHKSIPVPKEDWIIVEKTHEPIIDMETWLAVSHKFQGRVKPKSSGKIHFFSQKVYCAECKKVFHHSVSKSGNGNVFHYLGCSTVKKGAPLCDNRFAIRMDYLEQFILEEINQYIKAYHDSEILTNQFHDIDSSNSEVNKKIQALREEKKKIKNVLQKRNTYLKKLYEDRVEGFLDDEQFRSLSDDFSDEVSSLKTRVSLIDDEIEELERKKEHVVDRGKIFQKYSSIEKLDRKILNEFIDRIYIGKLDKSIKEREIIIEWSI